MPAGSLAVPVDSIDHPVGAVAELEIKPVRRWADHADLVAQDLVARRSRHEQNSLQPIAANHVVLVRIEPADCRVGRAEQDPLLASCPAPARKHSAWRRQRRRRSSDRRDRPDRAR